MEDKKGKNPPQNSWNIFQTRELIKFLWNIARRGIPTRESTGISDAMGSQVYEMLLDHRYKWGYTGELQEQNLPSERSLQAQSGSKQADTSARYCQAGLLLSPILAKSSGCLLHTGTDPHLGVLATVHCPPRHRLKPFNAARQQLVEKSRKERTVHHYRS